MTKQREFEDCTGSGNLSTGECEGLVIGEVCHGCNGSGKIEDYGEGTECAGCNGMGFIFPTPPRPKQSLLSDLC